MAMAARWFVARLGHSIYNSVTMQEFCRVF